jgi:hypothetical protein
MGRPLRKLHQTHFCISVLPGYLQYPHHVRFRIPPSPKRMEEQGFVSKKDRLEKADRETVSQEAPRLPVIWYGILQIRQI